MSDDVSPTSRRQLLSSVASATAGLALLPRSAGAAAIEGAQPNAADAQEPLASVGDYEKAARRKMTAMAREYVTGGAGDEHTLAWNQSAWDEIKLRSRILNDVSHIDTTVRLFGRDLTHPIILSPTAYHKLVHPDGEIATARGAVTAHAAMILSSFSTVKLEDVASAGAGSPLWFQLYVNPDRGFTRALVERAEAAGYQALCLTVDTPILGARNRETRVGFRLPPGVTRANLESLSTTAASATHRPPEGAIYSAVLDPRVTWKDIDWLRGFTKVPLLFKGVMDAEDAKRAVETGVSGLIVSNHGARNLDTGPATVTALPRVAEAVRGRVPIIVDGGIRRGTDVIKALALGASAVGIGRPYLYGLAVNGAAGVSHVVQILRTELEMAMALTGRTSIGGIDSTVLWT